MKRTSVLILCTGNSCRSQMAEGMLRHLGGENFEVHSAGTRPKGVHPLAVKVMGEIGVDISNQESKSVDLFTDKDFDYVITVCDSAKETCSVFTGSVKKRLHWPFEDPDEAVGSKEVVLPVFRRVRDQIELRFADFLKKEAR